MTKSPPQQQSPAAQSPSAVDTGHVEEAEAVAHQAQTQIEAAPEDDFIDEAYGTDANSATSTSLSSSARDFAFENGRRYHKFREGQYHFPNDEPEQAREDMKHAMVVNLCGGKLHYAPLKNPQQMIDLGTGTGIWAIDSQSCSYISRDHT